MPNDPIAALRHRDFVYLITNTFFLTAAILMQEVIVGYFLYKLTHDPLTLGIIGLVEALPYMSLALFGGHFADRKNKKRMMQISLLVILASSIALWVITLPSIQHQIDTTTTVLLTYGILATIGFARGFYSPAASSIRAFLIPREKYANSATWNSTFWQMGAILGPGVSGFMYAYMGMSNALIVVISLIVLSSILISLINYTNVVEAVETDQNIWQSIKEGFDFVFGNKIMLYSTSLDLVAVLFGGVIAILPVFAEDILKVGAEGLGILRAAPSIGAVLTIIATAYYSPIHKAWQNMMIAVAGFGIATLIFAVSTNFWLSVAMLFLTGAFDSISVVIRQTIVQVIPPDHIRGRVVSVISIFVSSSNEIGAFESGAAARVLGTVRSVLAGGAVTMGIVTYIYFKSKDLLKVKLQ